MLKKDFKFEDIVNVLKKFFELKDLDVKDVEIKKESNKLIIAVKSILVKFIGILNFVFKVMLNVIMIEDIKKEF